METRSTGFALKARLGRKRRQRSEKSMLDKVCIVLPFILQLYCHTFTLTLPLRETRGGWPLPTVKTEANGDSWSTYMKGDLPWLVRCARRAALQEKSHVCIPFPGMVQPLPHSVPRRLSLTACLCSHPTNIHKLIQNTEPYNEKWRFFLRRLYP
jgi:hypothetical protein